MDDMHDIGEWVTGQWVVGVAGGRAEDRRSDPGGASGADGSAAKGGFKFDDQQIQRKAKEYNAFLTCLRGV